MAPSIFRRDPASGIGRSAHPVEARGRPIHGAKSFRRRRNAGPGDFTLSGDRKGQSVFLVALTLDDKTN